MPRFNKPESYTILPIPLLVLTPNWPFIAFPFASGDLGAKAVNVPLSLNSYKPKRWAYVTFNSQETMDGAMECGKLGCAPNQCSSCQQRDRSRSRSRSKDPDNSGSSQTRQPLANTPNVNNPHRDCSKSGLSSPPDIPANNQPSDMLIDPPVNIDSIIMPVPSQPATLTVQKPLNPLLPSFIPSSPVRAPISASSTVTIPNSSSSSSIPNTVFFPTQTRDEIQAINAKHSAIENKLDMLANSISGFIGSITSSSFSTNLASAADNNFNYDSFIQNPPNPIDIENLSLQDSLFSSNSLSPPPFNSFNISSFNINGLKIHFQNKIELLSNFFSLKQISFGNVKLRIFVVYIPPASDQALRDDTIDLLIQALSEAKRLGFHHAVCGDFNMHLDQFYPIFFNQPQIASKRMHRLFNFLLSSGYADYTPINFSDSLGTFHYADITSRIDYVWLCPLLKHFLLTSAIFDVCDLSFSDHNPVITYYDHFFLCSSIKLACARQLNWRSHRIFSFDSVTPSQWEDFSTHIDKLCHESPTIFASWHKWSIYLIRLNNIFRLYKSTLSAVPVLPLTLSSCWTDNFNKLFDILSHASKLLRGLHLLKEKEFQDSSIKAHIDSRDRNFDTDISSFITLALSRSRHQIVLDHVFINHPSAPRLLTDPKDISDAVKSFIKLFYNRLSSILATHNVLTGGNFAGLPGETCRDPIITLESIIHDANHNNSPLWILSQDISKAFDSVNLTMLKFALERICLPASAIMLLLSLFMNRSNWVFTAHGDTSSYWVRIGIDQGEVISPLLWIIYIDPLLTVLKKFYTLNNTSANHQKYVLISNSLPLTTTSTTSPVDFNLELSPLNSISSLSVTLIFITSSFRFLGVWFNIKGSRDFVKKQIASECNSFAATLRLARLSAKQVVYLYNTVLIPKLEYQMQVTHLSKKDCYTATRLIRSLVKQKANFSHSLSNPILYLSQALGLINLLMLIQFRFLIPVSPLKVDDWSLWSNTTAFKYDYIACTIASMVSTPFHMQHANFTSIFLDRTLPGHTPLYSCMSPKVFKACLKVLRKCHLYYLSQLITPSGSHLISWTAYQIVYIAQLADKRDYSLPHKWYLDIKANTTVPDSHDRLYDHYVCSPSTTSDIDLIPGATTTQKNRHWLVTLDGNDASLFGKQLSVQPKKDTCVIVY
ncbi:hypothetical protein RclHR1_12740005 [Rhizophagus clarus]|uniref:Reverse transcriptase domain-containing protein n=1 Tax=Rhizophagus clarus TaxID=94130 RepID=A0A2Z6QKJ9_9GLOM|nr:hypothetical protein RclHR1_12740005 [Rhizophagus clarus]